MVHSNGVAPGVEVATVDHVNVRGQPDIDRLRVQQFRTRKPNEKTRR
jgi:hypothetical protein